MWEEKVDDFSWPWFSAFAPQGSYALPLPAVLFACCDLRYVLRLLVVSPDVGSAVDGRRRGHEGTKGPGETPWSQQGTICCSLEGQGSQGRRDKDRELGTTLLSEVIGPLLSSSSLEFSL